MIAILHKRYRSWRYSRVEDKESNDSLPTNRRPAAWMMSEPFGIVALRHGRPVNGIELSGMFTPSSEHSLLGNAAFTTASPTHSPPWPIWTSPYFNPTAQLPAHRSRFVETGIFESTDGSPGPVHGNAFYLGHTARHATVEQIKQEGLDDEAMGRPEPWNSAGHRPSERASTQNPSPRWIDVESASGRAVRPTRAGRSDAVQPAFWGEAMDFAALHRHRLSHTAETGQLMRRPPPDHGTQSVADGGTSSRPPSMNRPSQEMGPSSGIIGGQDRVSHIPHLPHQGSPIGPEGIQAPPQAHGRAVQGGPRAPLQTGDVNQRINPLGSSPTDGHFQVLFTGSHQAEGRNAVTVGEPTGGPSKTVEKSKKVLRKKESMQRLK